MARAALDIETIARDGIEPVAVAATADGAYIDNTSEKVIVKVDNTGVGSITITIPTPNTIDGLAIPDRTVAIAAGVSKFIGPFPNAVYGQGTNDNVVYLDTDTPADTEWQAFRLGSLSY